MKHDNYIELDVREDLRMKKEPFEKIMGAVSSLKDGQDFILHAIFNPEPLHRVLGKKGFSHNVEKLEEDHWKITYSKQEVGVNGSTR